MAIKQSPMPRHTTEPNHVLIGGIRRPCLKMNPGTYAKKSPPISTEECPVLPSWYHQRAQFQSQVALHGEVGTAATAMITLGGDVSTNETKWSKRYEKFLEWQNKKEAAKPSKKLARWMDYQNRRFSENKLLASHQAKLEAAGFKFQAPKPRPTFEQRILQLEHFKRVHGHIAVKKQHNSVPSWDGLYNFIQGRRRKQQRGELPSKELDALVAMGVSMQMANWHPSQASLDSLSGSSKEDD